MTYTAEQLRRDAIAIERMHGETLTVEWRGHQASQLRAHADLLDWKARIEAAQGKDVRGLVENLQKASDNYGSCYSPDGDVDEAGLRDTAHSFGHLFSQSAYLLESLSAKLAERERQIASWEYSAKYDDEHYKALQAKLAEREAEARDYKFRAQMNSDAIQHYSERAEKAEAEASRMRVDIVAAIDGQPCPTPEQWRQMQMLINERLRRDYPEGK